MRADDLRHFPTLAKLKPPRVMRIFGGLTIITIISIIVFCIVVPWVQTAPGTGTVMALDPRDRQQKITAMVSGRIDSWFVTDGSAVNAGDPIVRILDIDPQLLDRLDSQQRQLRACSRHKRAARRGVHGRVDDICRNNRHSAARGAGQSRRDAGRNMPQGCANIPRR